MLVSFFGGGLGGGLVGGVGAVCVPALTPLCLLASHAPSRALARLYACPRVRACVCVCVRVRMRTREHAPVCACLCLCPRVCLCPRLYARACACTRGRACVYVWRGSLSAGAGVVSRGCFKSFFVWCLCRSGGVVVASVVVYICCPGCIVVWLCVRMELPARGRKQPGR